MCAKYGLDVPTHNLKVCVHVGVGYCVCYIYTVVYTIVFVNVCMQTCGFDNDFVINDIRVSALSCYGECMNNMGCYWYVAVCVRVVLRVLLFMCV